MILDGGAFRYRKSSGIGKCFERRSFNRKVGRDRMCESKLLVFEGFPAEEGG
jgi:hypothetical protein